MVMGWRKNEVLVRLDVSWRLDSRTGSCAKDGGFCGTDIS